MKEDKKADRAVWKEGQVAEMEQRETKRQGNGQLRRYTAAQMSSQTERQETNWGRRVRSSTRKHKYLIKARLTGEQRVQRTSPPKPFPETRERTWVTMIFHTYCSISTMLCFMVGVTGSTVMCYCV